MVESEIENNKINLSMNVSKSYFKHLQSTKQTSNIKKKQLKFDIFTDEMVGLDQIENLIDENF